MGSNGSSGIMKEFWMGKLLKEGLAHLDKLPDKKDNNMIPCSLTLFREDKDTEIKKITVYGQGETPPEIGRRFLMMTNDKDPETIVTGIINCIQWSGQPCKKGIYPRAIFQTGGSTYRWDRLGGEDANAK